MQSLQDLISLVRVYRRQPDEALLTAAYNYAKEKHAGQKRACGECYFTHPIAVAKILIKLRLDETTIAAALLHDTIEDTSSTKDEITEKFGQEIANLVDGLTKLNKLDLISKKAIQAENLRKLLLAVTSDIRVLLVKLADRLHNMRTLQVMRKAKRYRIARETLDIYAPLAGRMGLQDIKEELENLSFKYLNEEAYNTISARLEQSLIGNKDLLDLVAKELEGYCQEENISSIIKRRMKKPYSVFHKMEIKGLKYEELSDIFAFRIIVREVLDCYKLLGVIHTKWRMVPGRFKDYISTPKQNGYRSIHTTVVSPHGQRIELQIRTNYMDEVAEYGIAAHSSYKDGEAFVELCRDNNAEVSAWLRRTIELLSEGESPEEFLEHTRLELFQDQVFCFTPKGQMLILPREAVVLDFAYAVHTSVGNSCVGAKVNGRHVSVTEKLHTGDEVEILCDKNAKPQLIYEKLVKTGRAKIAIRRATRDAAKQKYVLIGIVRLEHYFKYHNKNFDRKYIDMIYSRFSYSDGDALLVAVARAEVTPEDVYTAIFPEDRVKNNNENKVKSGYSLKEVLKNIPSLGKPLWGRRFVKSQDSKSYFDGRELPIYGIDPGLSVHVASKGIVPGDKIIGVVNSEENKLFIYPTAAKLPPCVKKFSEIIDLQWSESQGNKRYKASIYVSSKNQPGAISQIAHVMEQKDVNIIDIKFVEIESLIGNLEFEVEVWNLEQLNSVIKSIRSLSVVGQVHRLYY